MSTLQSNDTTALAQPAVQALDQESKSGPALPLCYEAAVNTLLDDGFLKIEANLGSQNFSHMIDVQNHVYFKAEAKSIVAFSYFGSKVQGPPQRVHGGAIFSTIDMLLALCTCRSMECLAFTANVSINYRGPLNLCSWMRTEVRVDRVEKMKKVFLTFESTTMAPASSAKSKSVVKTSDGSGVDNETESCAPHPTENLVVNGTSLFIAKLGVKSSI